MRGIHDRTIRGLRIYLATPRLRGLLALNLSVAAAGAMVIVNTVVLVRGGLGRSEGDVALALMAFGAGSMLVALSLPRLLATVSDRGVMMASATLLAALMLAIGVVSLLVTPPWPVLLAVWLLLGLGYGGVLTPTGRILVRSSSAEDRPALFAAQFALSHACWLLTYPLAGFLGAAAGLHAAFLVLGLVTLLGASVAPLFWRRPDEVVLEHTHGDLPPDHPHVAGATATGAGFRHAHAFVIDDTHRRWPR
jgi:MFS family permease